MKKILGLDLGVSSIGWAMINEAEVNTENSSIVKIGVRVNPLTVDEQQNFEKGKSITTNADRTLRRSARRNLQRFKLRRDNLIEVLKDNNFITDDTILSEQGNFSTFETLRLRAKAAKEEISLEEFARVLLMINKKRGYKSSRKAKNEEEGQVIDGMAVAKIMYEDNLTPGQYALGLLKSGKRNIPDFYRSDLQNEFDKIWDCQKQFYSEVLTNELKESLQHKNKTQTWAICKEPFNIVGVKREAKGDELKRENYIWRSDALFKQIGLEELAVVLQEINSQLKNSSGYLGAISDRSKELFFNKETIGEYLISKLNENSNYSTKNKVFYRQDYLDEFTILWETQSKFHSELTDDLKKEIRDIIIFYQRKLKSQKGLISICELESQEKEFVIDGKKKVKIVGSKVCPRSSPLFQEFKVWQILNNIEVKIKDTKAKKLKSKTLFDETDELLERRYLHQEEKEILFRELQHREKLSCKEVLEILFANPKELEINYKTIEGNKTIASFFTAYQKILIDSGHKEYNFSKMKYDDVVNILEPIFEVLGIKKEVLYYDSTANNDNPCKSNPINNLYSLWHLIYSYEDDKSKTGYDSLIKKLQKDYGFERESALLVSNISMLEDYSSLSSKAIRKILPYLKEGNGYDVACVLAGYKSHSKQSLTKEEIENKELKDRLEILPKNSLRNPVVEKILNQMINVVNAATERYGKPDEIRIELARELKKNAKEREDLTKAISKSTTEHEGYRALLEKEFGFTHVSRTDIIRYKLYLELEPNGFKTLYSNTYIPRDEIFTKRFDIEHIIPQAKLFDDSFSNKTLELRDVNLKKGKQTAYDYVLEAQGQQGLDDYLQRIKFLDKDGTRQKYRKLRMKDKDIPEGFIERDLRDSQYIAKKAKEILSSLVPVVTSTTGSITDRLREDWQLINVMQELNWNKYDRLGLTEIIEGRDGQKIYRIKDWTKRNDHRHHAMDALTIAFTKPSHIQYLNNLSAKSDKAGSIYGIREKELYRDERGKEKFKPPFALNDFRKQAKEHLENTLISIKAKNKVVTKNINKTKKKSGINKIIQLTPRGQLHNETIYGSCKKYKTKEEKVNASFNEEMIAKVAKKEYREALLKRFMEFDSDARKAFTGKNSLEKNPIYLDILQTKQVPVKVKIVDFETIYTIRKDVSPDLKIEKVLDKKIKNILQKRLDEFGNDAKKAFVNLEENPIYLNKEKGLEIKRVTITGVSNAIPLRNGRDFVNTGNNHHVAIYRDKEGNLQENVVSFFEATANVNLGLSVINKNYKADEGYEFLFTMKQNEYFVFPNETTGFNPKDIDLLNPINYSLISPNLFRVQKIASKDYYFRHHLETSIIDNNLLKGKTWFRCGLAGIKDIVKVRINHLGEIVHVGEY